MEVDHETEDNQRKEEDMIWKAFLEYDFDRNGNISVNDLKKALEDAGEKVTDDQCYRMISMSDPENRGFIQFAQFKQLIIEKREEERGSSAEELLDCFVAMGG